METLYDAAGGMTGLRRLAQAWHERVLADEIVSHAFHHGIREDHTERLAAYWAEALGGPAAYPERYGTEKLVVRLHSGQGEHEEMNRRAVEWFDVALADAGISEARLARVLHDYFQWGTDVEMYRSRADAEALPDDRPVPRWTWDGLAQDGSPSAE
jgi:hemoglobin